MIAQISEVLATYLRRAISRPFTAVVVIIPVIATASTAIALLTGEAKGLPFKKDQTAIALTWIGMLGFYCPILIAIHFKQQVIQVHQRRIPNAELRHVIVVVGLLALCAVGLPAALMAIGTWSWGLLGFVLVLTAVTFAVFALQGWLAFLIFPLCLPAVFSPVQRWVQELCQGQHESLGLPLMAAGICGIAVTLVRLLQMTEESTGYLNVYDFDLLDLNASYLRGCPRCPTTAEEAHPRAGFWKSLGWLGWRRAPTEPEVQLWPQWAKGSLWQRIRLRSLASEDSYPMWPFAVFYLAIFSLMYITMPSKPTFTMMLNALFMTFDPVFSVTSTMPRRRKRAATELLQPVARSQFFMEMGLAYAVRVPATWILFSIAWILPAYAFTDSPVWSRQMFNLLALTAASQVLFFGLTVWMMRYSIPYFSWTALCMGYYVAVIFAVTALLLTVDWRTTSLDALLWASPTILAAGALIIWDAYRRWMQTELG